MALSRCNKLSLDGPSDSVKFPRKQSMDIIECRHLAGWRDFCWFVSTAAGWLEYQIVERFLCRAKLPAHDHLA